MHDFPPQDEFETLPDAITRPGVHRSQQSLWHRVWPFLLVIVLGAGLGVGSVYLLTQNPDSKVSEILGDVAASEQPTDDPTDGETEPAPDPTDEATEPAPGPTDEATNEPTEPTDAPTDGATDEPTDGATDATVDRSASVRVLNASRTQGRAAQVADKITADGWTSVVAANFEGDRPSASIIYYRGPENLANAEQISTLTGITNLLEVASLRADISVVLLQ